MAAEVYVNEAELKKALKEVFVTVMRKATKEVVRTETAQAKASYTDRMTEMSYFQSQFSNKVKAPIWSGKSRDMTKANFSRKGQRFRLSYSVGTPYAYQFLHGIDRTNYIPGLHSRYGEKRNVLKKVSNKTELKKRLQGYINNYRATIYYS